MASSVNDLYRRLVEACGDGIETPPAGHKTSREWAKIWGRSIAHASRLLRAGVAAGLMGKKHYRTRVGGAIRPMPHYYETRAASVASAK
jgi:hypothetical protein